MVHITKNSLKVFLLKIYYPSKILQNYTLKFFIYFSYPYSRTDAMEGFHIPGDPYFLNQGNAGCIEEDPVEIMEEDPEDNLEEEEEEEDDHEDTDSEPEVYNPPRTD